MNGLRLVASLNLAFSCFLLALVWFMPKVEPEFARPSASSKRLAKINSSEGKAPLLRDTIQRPEETEISPIKERTEYASQSEETREEKTLTLPNDQNLRSAKDRSGFYEFNGQTSPFKEKDPLEEAESALISLDKIFN